MNTAAPFYQLKMPFSNFRTYLFMLLFVVGNLLLPQLTHLIPKGGLIFLPIYFFTLIGAYKFGTNVGLMTAVFSPLLNNFLFGMPPAFVLPIILIKSILIVVFASFIAGRYKQVSILHLFLVVLGYQLTGSLIEWGITNSFTMAIQDFTIGIPGMLIQIFGGWFILKKLAQYEY
jgi:hypothetical protein